MKNRVTDRAELRRLFQVAALLFLTLAAVGMPTGRWQPWLALVFAGVSLWLASVLQRRAHRPSVLRHGRTRRQVLP